MSIQLVELHFAQRPDVDFAAIQQRVEEILGEKISVPSPKEGSEVRLFCHTAHMIDYDEGQLPPQTALLRSDKPIDIARYAEDIQQSWRYRDCEPTLARSQHTLLVTELMAGALPAAERLRLFHGVLQAAVELTQPDILVFKHAQQAVAPENYLENVAEPPLMRPGSFNVRFFNVAESEGDMLMDTRGLHEIGMTDLQCHYNGLDPNDVSGQLYNLAMYLLEHGPVIESGHTIEGIEAGTKWECQFEKAMIAPEREVIDLCPESPHAAGKRE